MSFRDDLANPRSLAGERGAGLNKTPIRAMWFLLDEKSGWKAISDRGTTAFSVEQAIRLQS